VPHDADVELMFSKRSESPSLRPVTVLQLMRATQWHPSVEWTMEGAEVSQVGWAYSTLFDAETCAHEVTLVAQVVSIQAHATHKIIVLDDGTGRIEARCWVDLTAEGEVEKWADIMYVLIIQFSRAMTYGLSRENTYVRATGPLKSFGTKKYINGLHICPISDPHEVYYHIAEVIWVSLLLERGMVSQT
jgi:replication factor A2